MQMFEDRRLPLRLLANEMAKQLHVSTDMDGEDWIGLSQRKAYVIDRALHLIHEVVWSKWEVELCQKAYNYLDYIVKNETGKTLCSYCLNLNEDGTPHICKTLELK